jgi:hypothetical protein
MLLELTGDREGGLQYMSGVRVKTVIRVLLDLQARDGFRAILDFYADPEQETR